jgi:hypothetical protein
VSSFIYFFNGFPSLVGPGSFSVSWSIHNW